MGGPLFVSPLDPNLPRMDESSRFPLPRGPLHVPFHPPHGETPEDIDEYFPDVVKGILPPSTLCLLAGEPKAGKTDFATALSFAVASGQPFAGLKVIQGTVLWCAYEETTFERYAMHNFCPRKDDGELVPFLITYKLAPIDTDYGYDVLEHSILETGARLVVIDSLSSAISQTGVGAAQNMRALLSRYRELAFRLQVSILIIHHVNKATTSSNFRRLAHSHGIAAASCGHLLLESEPFTDAEGNQGRFVTLKMAGRLVGKRDQEFWSPGIVDYHPGTTALGVTDRAKDILALIKQGHDTYAKLEEVSPHNYQVLRNAVSELTRRGVIFTEKIAEKTSVKFVCPGKNTVTNPTISFGDNKESEPPLHSGGEGAGGEDPRIAAKKVAKPARQMKKVSELQPEVTRQLVKALKGEPPKRLEEPSWL